MLSARQSGISRPSFIKSSEIMSRQTTVDSLLLSVAAGQPSDTIVCSNESTFLARPRFIKSSEIMSRQSTVDSLVCWCRSRPVNRRLHIACIENNIGFHWQMSNISPQTVIAARTIFSVT